MDQNLIRSFESDAQLDREIPQRSEAGKSTLTSRLSPGLVLRVADPETARALGESLRGTRIARLADMVGGGRDDNGVAADAEAAVGRASASSGAPLPTGVQRQFEGSLGADLSSVRVHTGSESAQAAHAVGAKAYTVGQDIHFAAGRYQPEDPFGLHLLAHEVAHTVQQTGGAQRRQHKLEVSTPVDAAEHEADRAADAMVRGDRFAVDGAGAALSRVPTHVARDEEIPGLYKFQLTAKPLPPGVTSYKTLSPVAAAVKAGENGDSAIPDPAGLFDAAESNFTRYAQHCVNVQSSYHARAGGMLGGNHFFTEFAATAGQAHKLCETGAVEASGASSAIGMWIPALTSSQSTWNKAKTTAEAAGISVVADGAKGESTGLEAEALKLEGETQQGIVKNVLPQDEKSTSDPKAQERIKKSNDEQLAAGKNVKSSEKVLLDEATTNFEQSTGAVTTARSGVVTARKKAAASLSAGKVAANQERLKGAEDQKAKIDEIFAMIDKVQGAIDTGMGIVEGGEGLQLLQDTGKEAMGTKATQVAKLVLTLDGTIPGIEGEIAACKSVDANLGAIIKAQTIAADAESYTAALKAYRDAMKVMPERMNKYANAHAAFAEAVNQALIKRGTIKPGDDGVRKTMALLGDLRIALAATSSAVSATNDVSGAISAVAGINAAPQPDVCELKNFLPSHVKAFTSAPGHVSTILGVLSSREAKLRAYIEQLAV